MCVTFLAFRNGVSGPLMGRKYKLIILNNRDETFARKTSKLAWEDDVLAGRDEDAEERGTWLGINRRGDVGNLLSITEPSAVKLARGSVPSRGRIVDDFLRSSISLQDHCALVASTAERYNGFQFVALKRDAHGDYDMASVTNRCVPKVLTEFRPPGIYGFGNSPKSIQLKKVLHGKRRFTELMDSFDFAHRSDDELVEELLKIGTDGTLSFPDEQLKIQTGVEEDEMYKPLCSLFVRYPDSTRYGTRSHSILLMDGEDNVTFYERRMTDFPDHIGDAQWQTTVERFRVETT